MKRALWAAVAVVLVVSGYLAGSQPWDTVRAQEDRTITVQVAAGVGGTDEGGECAPFGVVEPDGPLPFRQLIINNAIGAVIGAVDLETGTIEDGDCVIEATFDIYDTPFYTFTVDDIYRNTISSEALDDQDWRYEVWLGITVP